MQMCKEGKACISFRCGKPDTDDLKDMGVHGSVMLRWFLEKQDWMAWIEFIWH